MNGNGNGNGHSAAIAGQYRTILWTVVFIVHTALWGYAFFLHGQIGAHQSVMDKRDYWWKWAADENEARRAEIRELKAHIKEIEAQVYTPEWWRFQEDRATRRLYQDRQQKGGR